MSLHETMAHEPANSAGETAHVATIVPPNEVNLNRTASELPGHNGITPTQNKSSLVGARRGIIGSLRRRLSAMVARGGMFRLGALSLVDQGIVSAVNFLTLVLLGRHVGHGSGEAAQQELGLYQLGFSIVLLAMCAQNALIAVPYTVFGNRMDDRRRARYAGSTLVQQAVLTVIISALLALAGCLAGLDWSSWAAKSSPTAAWMAAAASFGRVAWILAATVPVIMLREFVRRVAFAHLQVFKALLLDAAVAMVQLAGLLALKMSGRLTAANAFGTIAAACLAAGVMVGFSMRKAFAPQTARLWDDLKLNWSFGKWAFAGQAVYLLMVYCVSWMLILLESAEATGRYAACMSLVLVANPLLLGLNNFLSPHAIHTFHSQGLTAMRRLLWRTAVAVCSAVGILCALLVLAGGPLLTMVYNQTFTGEQQIVSVLSLNLFLFGLSMSAENGLLALGRPKAIFVANSVGLIVTVAAAIVCINIHGVLGAAIAAVLGQAVATGGKCLLLSLTYQEQGEVSTPTIAVDLKA